MNRCGVGFKRISFFY